ncbi:Golgi apparatus protein 1-like [Oppia nitens]|uniref:Golgi apparatus protein 1-like n=1 Tax=Oppia nitens TaxID=1686743 RepID=UPI0023DBB676|nr:Golgi apparatus protein 1-like [Oppia nitens]
MNLVFNLVLILSTSICIGIAADDQHLIQRLPKNGQYFDDKSINSVDTIGKSGHHRTPDSIPVGKLSAHPDCKEDIERICGRMGTDLDNNLSVLTCIQNKEKDTYLSEVCHHLLWSFKRNLTDDNSFAGYAKNVCNRLITENAECLKAEDEQVMSPSANLMSCLIERLVPETDVECKNFLTKIELIIFSDYRLIHKFTDFCAKDIDDLKCGRIDMNVDSFHTQGETIECLEKSTDKLSTKCKHQILRIAELQSDDFHLDRGLYFACRDDREKFCHRIESGDGRVYRCLMKHKLEKDLSHNCREKLFQREMLAIRDYKVAHGLAKTCKQDIKKYECREDTSDHKEIRLAQILLCLENALNQNQKIDSQCRVEMLSHRRNLMDNYNLTPDLVSACDNDIQEFCSGLEKGGKTLHCLMKHTKRSRGKGMKRGQITSQCRRSLEDLLKETNVAEDWRVDPVLQESCQASVELVCKDIEPGEGRVMACLLDHMNSKDISDDCRQNLHQIQYFMVRQFELDAPIYKSCHTDAVKYCHAKRDWIIKPSAMDLERGPSVLSCLYRYAYHPNDKTRLTPQCVFDIRRVMRQRAQSVDLMPDIEEPCIQDLSHYCSGQFDGQQEDDVLKNGYETECLQQNYENLEPKCQQAIGNFTEDLAAYVELNYPIIKVCAVAIKDVCTGILDRDIDESDVMECLILNKNKKEVKRYPKCVVAINHFQVLQLKNYRFSHRFKELCRPDVLQYCPSVTTKYEVIKCLSGIVFNDTMSSRRRQRISSNCQNQLKVELLERNENIQLDPILDRACAHDRNSLCPNNEPGEGRVVECLKSNMHRLTKACQRLLFERQRIEMDDNSVDYPLVTNCKAAIVKFCPNDDYKDILLCLRDHRHSIGMDDRCRTIVIKRLAQQNSDYRLNPQLKTACEKDVPKFCAKVLDEHPNDEQLEGKVIACLKKQYVLNKLTQTCETQIVSIIQEVSDNIELDPILYNSCKYEIKIKCSQDVNDITECLKMKFQNKEITNDLCRREVARLITQTKADIHSDPLLYKVCVQDLKRFCSDIPVGHGRQLSCLLAEHESTSHLSPECKTMLTKRVEMFEYAAQLAPAESVADVYKVVASSPSKNYFIFVLMCCVSVIFAGGLLCGRVTKRIATNDKIK